MVDIMRMYCRHSLDTLRKYVDLLAGLRLNQLQLYTEHTFAYSGCEEVLCG